MAGAVGIEPTNRGIKTRCLTAWLRPIIIKTFNLLRVLFASYFKTFLQSKKIGTNINFTTLSFYVEVSFHKYNGGQYE